MLFNYTFNKNLLKTKGNRTLVYRNFLLLFTPLWCGNMLCTFVLCHPVQNQYNINSIVGCGSTQNCIFSSKKWESQLGMLITKSLHYGSHRQPTLA